MDRLIRLAAKVPLANSVFERPARRRPPHPFFNVIRLTLVIAGVIPFSSFAQNANENERQHPQRRGGSKQTGTTKTHSLASNRRDLIVLENLLRSLLLVSLWLLGTAGAHAEGSCPPGMYPNNPGSTNGVNGCNPIPGYGKEGQQQEPSPPTSVWEDRWGAMATDEPRGVLGAATGYSNEQAAQRAALSDCKAKGGMNCTLTNSYRNGCTALTVSDSKFYYGADATTDVVASMGMRACTEAGNKNCHTYYTACSPPVRIQ